MDPDFEYQFTALRKTHNQGVFDVYSPDMLRCRKSGVLTGLPDGYGRGRIIGDYRRVALYGIRYWSAKRELQFADLQPALERGEVLEATLRLREELAEQRRALLQMQEMAARYGCDIAHPARTAREAVQWLYFAYPGGGEVAERRPPCRWGARPPSSTSISNAICAPVY
ncbi:formate C-acetyltransferase [Klebsiella pneumoniae]|uniref:Formate C-acetyltransferase n=1 Tax=Klebsiella pneumoniae TaxID=573 RepID=A0A2X3CG72_KLEPN|nr:formate C-acetyltransferase [Klebsiella pneumoniae]